MFFSICNVKYHMFYVFMFSGMLHLPTIPVVPLCLFFVVAENSFWLHRSVFWLWQEQVLGFTSLPTIPVVPLCQFFGCGGKKFWVTQFLRKIHIWLL
jgi:hypothetical protein